MIKIQASQNAFHWVQTVLNRCKLGIIWLKALHGQQNFFTKGYITDYTHNHPPPPSHTPPTEITVVVALEQEQEGSEPELVNLLMSLGIDS